MLDYIRNSAQSFGVKVAFGIIILVFVFWGIGNFNDRDYSNVVAVVNGEPILAQEFEKAYRNAEEYILSNNPGATREMLAREHLGRRVLNDMIQLTLMSQEAAKSGIEITPLELRMAVGKMKSFQDENGNFDPAAYKNILDAQRISPAQYEKELAAQLMRDKLYMLVTAPVWVDPDEARQRYNFLRERRLLDYLFIPAADFYGKTEVTDAEAKQWYDDHTADFAIPPRVDVEYIEVRPENLADAANMDESAARAWYNANKSRFETQEQAHLRHILIPVAEDADDEALLEARKKLEAAQKDIAGGKPFAAVADIYNSAQAADKGGDLGWVLRGQTIPQFEEAAFALAAGEMSGEVRTPFGLHLILMEEKKPAGIRPYEEVIDEARAGAAYDEGSEKLHDALDNLIEDNILQKPMTESAAKYGLKVQESGLVDRNGLMGKLGINADGATAIFGSSAGDPIDTALDGGDKYIIARIKSSEPAATKPFAEVRDGIEKILKSEKALSLAMTDAGKILEKIKNEKLSQIKEQQPSLVSDVTVDRGQMPADFEADASLSETIFAQKPGSWLPQAYSVKKAGDAGAMLVHVDKMLPPDAGEFASVEEIMVNGVKRERMDAIFELFMRNLVDKADIKVTNTNLVDRVNM